MIKTYLLAAALFLCTLSQAGLVFQLTAENSATAAGKDGKALEPLKAEGVVYVDGASGRALRTDSLKELSYNAEGLFGKQGTLSFWFSPDFNAFDTDFTKVSSLISLTGKDGVPQHFPWMHIYSGLEFTLKSDSGNAYQIAASGVSGLTRGDWRHVVITWGQGNWCTIYINGVAAAYNRFSGVEFAVEKLSIGTIPEKLAGFPGRIDEIKIYDKALTGEEIFKEYSSLAIFDLIVDRQIYPAGKDFQIEIQAAPLGHLHGNVPQKKYPSPSQGDIELILKDKAGKTISRESRQNLNISGLTPLTLKAPALEKGFYALHVQMKSGGKSLERAFTVYLGDREPENSSEESIQYLAPVFQMNAEKLSSTPAGTLRELKGVKYLESGTQKGSVLFCEVDLPEAYTKGELLALEIEWPDDKARAMGIYIYPPKGSGSEIRDRVGGGIAAGDEFPNSNDFCKTTYLFHGARTKYLLELRTLISGRPAALASVTIRPVSGALPKLTLQLPPELPGRRIGHLDEDQSFDYNFDWDNTRPILGNTLPVDEKLVCQLIEYLNYTGQNLFTLPLMRYDFTAYQRFPFDPGARVLPFSTDIGYWVEMFGKYGIEFDTIANIVTPPELENPYFKRKYTREGMVTASVDGMESGYGRNNPVHPENRRMVLAEVREFMQRFGKLSNMKGFDLWLEWPGVSFTDKTFGFDDFTVELFSRESGVKVPDFQENVFKKRYEFLMNDQNRAKWQAWRAAKTTELIKAIRAEIDKFRPDMTLYVSCRVPEGNTGLLTVENLDPVKELYESRSLDVNEVNRIPNVVFNPMRNPLQKLWDKHWNNSFSTSDEAMSDRARFLPFRRADRNYINSYRTYFESFSKSPMQEQYPSNFQNCELKPHGRFFLKDLAESIAFTDAQRICVGAQPLASMGREAEMREFVKAYRALPDLPFQDVKDAVDPVTVRFLNTANGTYLYAVNLIHAPVEVMLKINGAGNMSDLSSGEKIAQGNGSFNISLKPFELRSFLITGKVSPEFAGMQVPPEFKAETLRLINEKAEAAALLKENGVAPEALLKRIKTMQDLSAREQYAEIYRLIFSKMISKLDDDVQQFKSGYLQQQQKMLKESRISVNCGTDEYYREKSGKLYLPDQKWDGSADYGYTGKALTVERNTEKMPAGALKPLFNKELYNIDGYCFKVKNGTYQLKLYMRVGYEPARKKDIFKMTIGINGKTVRKDYDIFANENTDGYAVVAIDKVAPVNGVISIEFTPHGDDRSVCLLNAIEIAPQN